jgi:fermentation-respiration switch protein FrsA (DUF1100 family)
MKSVTFPNGPIKMAGNLHLPKDFSKVRSYVAIVCVHPAGGVKEQTTGLYAAKLADEGMVALAYDAFHLAEQLLTQPLRLIAGSTAGSLWFSQDAFKRAGSSDKSLHIVEGGTHIAMYDTPEYVKQAMAQLVPLYQNAGQSSSASNFVGPLSAHAATNVAKSAASPA